MIEEYQISDDVCDGLLTLYDECKEVAEPGTIALKDSKHLGYGINIVDPEKKKCTDLYWADIPKTGIKSHPRFKDQEYLTHVNDFVEQYSNQYLSGHPLKMNGNPKIQY